MGSIVASLLAIGYSASEINVIMQGELNIDSIIDKKGLFVNPLSFMREYGVAPGNLLHNKIGDLIKKKTNNPDYTIEQLYNDKKIKLVIVGTNLNKRNSVYFYYDP